MSVDGRILADVFGAVSTRDGEAADAMVDSMDLAECRLYLKASLGALAAMVSALGEIAGRDLCARIICGVLEP